MTDPETTVRALFDGCAVTGEIQSAIDRYVHPECAWENTGLPTANGLPAIKAFWQQFIDGYDMQAMIVEIIAIATVGDTVVTERIDHFDNAAGDRVASLPVAGTFVVRDGLVVAWRDYFDPRPFLPEG